MSSRFNDKNTFSKLKKKKIQISAVRTGVCAYMEATLLAITLKIIIIIIIIVIIIIIILIKSKEPLLN